VKALDADVDADVDADADADADADVALLALPRITHPLPHQSAKTPKSRKPRNAGLSVEAMKRRLRRRA